MKKLFSLVLALVLAAGLATSAFAASYVKSPTSNPLPEITVTVDDPTYPAVIEKTEIKDGSKVVYIKDDDTCHDELIVTPYSKKDGMQDVVSHGGNAYKEIARQSQEDLEAAYQEVMALKQSGGLLTSLTGVDANYVTDLKNAAKRAGTTVENIYVSDLFDVTYYECIDDSAGPGNQPVEHKIEDDSINDEHARVYKIKVDDFVLSNFVALLHRPSDMTGKWEVVDATVDRVNNTISFKVNVIPRQTQLSTDNKDDEVNLSPFAIVVKKGPIGGPTSPKTADPMSLVTLAMALTASAGGLVVLGKRKHD